MAATAITNPVKIARMGRPTKPLAHYTNRIRQVRERLGLTQQAAAARIGMSHQNLQRYETGKRGLKMSQAEVIARGLGVPVTQLLPSTDPAKDEQERNLLGIYRRLSADDRDRLIKMATALLPVPTVIGRKA